MVGRKAVPSLSLALSRARACAARLEGPARPLGVHGRRRLGCAREGRRGGARAEAARRVGGRRRRRKGGQRRIGGKRTGGRRIGGKRA
eukprot:3526033-Pleurochrysis_carterae.AAC.2